MKLLLCQNCWDVFKLDFDLRQCKCGEVKGRYITNSEAEVTANAISIGLGNGAVEQAIGEMRMHQMVTKDKADRSSYHEPRKGLIAYAWVRPNTGPGNPHTRIMEAD